MYKFKGKDGNFVEVDSESYRPFTGIKDGQDKDIYLGDRVKVGNTVYTVVWNNNGFKLLNDGDHSEFPHNLYMEVVA